MTPGLVQKQRPKMVQPPPEIITLLRTVSPFSSAVPEVAGWDGRRMSIHHPICLGARVEPTVPRFGSPDP